MQFFKNDELLNLFATKFGPEIMDVSNSDFKYIQKIDWSLYTNPHQYFTSEREFLIGAILGKLDPELVCQFPTLQDIFRIKESGSILKTKAQKIDSAMYQAIRKTTLWLNTASENKEISPTESYRIQNSFEICWRKI